MNEESQDRLHNTPCNSLTCCHKRGGGCGAKDWKQKPTASLKDIFQGTAREEISGEVLFKFKKKRKGLRGGEGGRKERKVSSTTVLGCPCPVAGPGAAGATLRRAGGALSSGCTFHIEFFSLCQWQKKVLIPSIYQALKYLGSIIPVHTNSNHNLKFNFNFTFIWSWLSCTTAQIGIVTGAAKVPFHQISLPPSKESR